MRVEDCHSEYSLRRMTTAFPLHTTDEAQVEAESLLRINQQLHSRNAKSLILLRWSIALSHQFN
jgi:hypothetical protein